MRSAVREEDRRRQLTERYISVLNLPHVAKRPCVDNLNSSNLASALFAYLPTLLEELVLRAVLFEVNADDAPTVTRRKKCNANVAKPILLRMDNQDTEL